MVYGFQHLLVLHWPVQRGHFFFATCGPWKNQKSAPPHTQPGRRLQAGPSPGYTLVARYIRKYSKKQKQIAKTKKTSKTKQNTQAANKENTVRKTFKNVPKTPEYGNEQTVGNVGFSKFTFSSVSLAFHFFLSISGSDVLSSLVIWSPHRSVSLRSH